MQTRRITLIDGHPDPDPGRFVHALADTYAAAALAAGHEVRRIVVAELSFDLLEVAPSGRRVRFRPRSPRRRTILHGPNIW